MVVVLRVREGHPSEACPAYPAYLAFLASPYLAYPSPAFPFQAYRVPAFVTSLEEVHLELAIC